MINTGGVRVTADWVMRRIPGGRLLSAGRTRACRGHRVYWRRSHVERWMKTHGLDKPRRLGRLDELAQAKGIGYWEARRTHEPAVVLGYSNKWYDLDA